MKLTDKQLELFKSNLSWWIKNIYDENPPIDIDDLADMDEFCTIMSIDEATIEEQVKNRCRVISYPHDSKSYIISVRICDQKDHNKGRLMKFFISLVRFSPYTTTETLIDMKLLSNMVYKLEK